ncbi:MAG: hypothetical protein NTU49_02135, partial [Gammaproteobacteria bacterium]|nr:hypothetical protein [Gammaproteobacteria bacterium]
EKVEKIEAKKTVIKTIDGVEKPVEVVVAPNPDLLDDKKKKEVDDAKDLLAAAKKVQQDEIEKLIENAAALRVEITALVENVKSQIGAMAKIDGPDELKKAYDAIKMMLEGDSKIKILIHQIEELIKEAKKYGATEEQLAKFDLSDPTDELLAELNKTVLSVEEDQRKAEINAILVVVEELRADLVKEVEKIEPEITKLLTTKFPSAEKIVEVHSKILSAITGENSQIKAIIDRLFELQKFANDLCKENEPLFSFAEKIVAEQVDPLEQKLSLAKEVAKLSLRARDLSKKENDFSAKNSAVAMFLKPDDGSVAVAGEENKKAEEAPAEAAEAEIKRVRDECVAVKKDIATLLETGKITAESEFETEINKTNLLVAKKELEVVMSEAKVEIKKVGGYADAVKNSQVVIDAVAAINTALAIVISADEKDIKVITNKIASVTVAFESCVKKADETKKELIKGLADKVKGSIEVFEEDLNKLNPDAKIARMSSLKITMTLVDLLNEKNSNLEYADVLLDEVKKQIEISGYAPEIKAAAVTHFEEKITAAKAKIDSIFLKYFTVKEELNLEVQEAKKFTLKAIEESKSPAEKIAKYAAEIEKHNRLKANLTKKHNKVLMSLSTEENSEPTLPQEIKNEYDKASSHLAAENKKAKEAVETIVTVAREAVTSEVGRIEALLKTPIASDVISQIKADLVVLMTSAVTADAINDEILKAIDTLESFLPTENQKNFVEQVTDFTADCNAKLQTQENNLTAAAASSLQNSAESDGDDAALAHAVANEIDVTKELMDKGFYSHTKDLSHNDGVQGLKHLEGTSVVDGATKTSYLGSLVLPQLKNSSSALEFPQEISESFQGNLQKALSDASSKQHVGDQVFLFAMNRVRGPGRLDDGTIVSELGGHDTILEVTLSAVGADEKRKITINNIDSVVHEAENSNDPRAAAIINAVSDAFPDATPATAVRYKVSELGAQNENECVSNMLVGIEARMASPEQKPDFDAIKDKPCDIQLRAMKIVACEDNRRAENSPDPIDPLKMIDPEQLKIVTAEDVKKYALVVPNMKEGDVAYIPALDNLLNPKNDSENNHDDDDDDDGEAEEDDKKKDVQVIEIGSEFNSLTKEAKQTISEQAALAVCVDSQLNPIVNAAGEKITLAIKKTEAGADDVSVSEDGKTCEVIYTATATPASQSNGDVPKTAEITVTSTSLDDNKRKLEATSSNPGLVGTEE